MCRRLDLVADSAMRPPLKFHQRLPGYRPTPLIDVPELARLLGIGQVLVKNESSRLGLPAFKILGASWAVYRALEAAANRGGNRSWACRGCPRNLEPWRTIDELAQRLAPLRPLTLATATDGNHGRAVAHMAALLGFAARIFVPAGTAQARIDGIAGEGATVEVWTELMTTQSSGRRARRANVASLFQILPGRATKKSRNG